MSLKELDLSKVKAWILRTQSEKFLIILSEGELAVLKQLDPTELTLFDLGVE